MPDHDAPGGGTRCRLCGASLLHDVVDLGMTPLCEALVPAEHLNEMEPFYPLRPQVCHECFLVQLEEYVPPEGIFTDDYPYFSSYSDAWVEHARRYVAMAVERFGLDDRSFVAEVASNDGYLLRHAVAAGIRVLGIEPAANVAEVAVEHGVPTVVEFFGLDRARTLVQEHGRADLLVANNVLAHTPELHDFIAGLAVFLADDGVLTLEFPNVMRLIAENQFDTIYHEHFSYFSFHTVERALAMHDLVVFDVEELATHGGSLRVFACHATSTANPVSLRVEVQRAREQAAGVTDLGTYRAFAERVRRAKRDLLQFLITAKHDGKKIVAYGAAGKGNTLLNYCGIGTDFIDFVVDRNPHKHGKYTPGTHIPICDPATLRDAQPDLVLILPWNLQDEIMQQVRDTCGWDGTFVVPIPSVKLVRSSATARVVAR
jgi:SAM-dependent methyltransferase